MLGNITFTSDKWALYLPGILMILDCVCGFVSAFVKKDLKPSKMREGLYKKFGELMMLVLAGLFVNALTIPPIFFTSLSIYVCATETLSILKIISESGIKIPEFFTSLFSKSK